MLRKNKQTKQVNFLDPLFLQCTVSLDLSHQICRLKYQTAPFFEHLMVVSEFRSYTRKFFFRDLCGYSFHSTKCSTKCKIASIDTAFVPPLCLHCASIMSLWNTMETQLRHNGDTMETQWRHWRHNGCKQASLFSTQRWVLIFKNNMYR